MRLSTLALASLALAAAGSTASAAIIINDGFEYADQAAYDAAWPAQVTANGNATLDATRAKTGLKSVTIPATPALNRSRKTFAEIGEPRTYAPGVAESVIWSYDFFDSASTAAPYRGYANLADGAGSGNGQIVSIGLNNNLSAANDGGNYYMARVTGFTPTYAASTTGTNPAATAGAFFKLNDAGAPLRSTGWHNLRVVVDTENFSFYVDGILSEVVPNTFIDRSYDNISIGSGVTSATAYGFDNMYLEVVPEPTTLATLGFLSLLGRRRTR